MRRRETSVHSEWRSKKLSEREWMSRLDTTWSLTGEDFAVTSSWVDISYDIDGITRSWSGRAGIYGSRLTYGVSTASIWTVGSFFLGFLLVTCFILFLSFLGEMSGFPWGR